MQKKHKDNLTDYNIWNVSNYIYEYMKREWHNKRSAIDRHKPQHINSVYWQTQSLNIQRKTPKTPHLS